jgi:hypothetical protein
VGGAQLRHSCDPPKAGGKLTMEHSADNSFQVTACARRPYAALMLVGAVILAGVALRLYKLSEEAPWLGDETCILIPLDAQSSSVWSYLSIVRKEDPVIAPAYPLLAYGWAALTGKSVVGMRCLSVLLGSITIGVTYAIGKELFGRTAGLFASLCLALSITHIYYSQEIRAYALMLLAASISGYGFLKALRTGHRGWWAVNVAGNSILLFSHLFAWTIPLAQGATLLLFRRKKRCMVSTWMLAHSPIVLALAVWVATIDFPTLESATKGNVVVPSIGHLLITLLILAGGRIYENCSPAPYMATGVSLDVAIAGVVTAAALCAVLETVWRTTPMAWRRPIFAGATHSPNACERRCGPEELVFLLLWLVGPPVVLAILARLWRPCFICRYVLPGMVPLFLLAGGGMALLPRARTRAAVACALSILYGYQFFALEGPLRLNWPAAIALVERARLPADEVYVWHDFVAHTYRYNYRTATGHDPDYEVRSIEYLCDMRKIVPEATQAGRNVWLIIWTPSHSDSFEPELNRCQITFTRTQIPGGFPRLEVYFFPARRQRVISSPDTKYQVGIKRR